jgi:hypothetical protein
MGNDLRDILNFPLCARDFSSTVNLLNGRFNRTRTNGANLLGLVILVVDDAVSMFLKINTKILSLLELAVSKAGNCIINFPFPQKLFRCCTLLETSIPVAYFTSSAAR